MHRPLKPLERAGRRLATSRPRRERNPLARRSSSIVKGAEIRPTVNTGGAAMLNFRFRASLAFPRFMQIRGGARREKEEERKSARRVGERASERACARAYSTDQVRRVREGPVWKWRVRVRVRASACVRNTLCALATYFWL